eukprot:2901840-Amphidinium_carterae.1
MDSVLFEYSPGSTVTLHFGQQYWKRYIAAQQKRLAKVRRAIEEGPSAVLNMVSDSSETVTSHVLEIRLIERSDHS